LETAILAAHFGNATGEDARKGDCRSMTLQPLFDASPAIQIHVAAALAAFGLGLAVLFRRKGTRIHRRTGMVWVALMLVTALSSFAIHELRVWGEWSPIHLVSAGTVAALFYAVRLARRGHIRGHANTMRGTFVGALVIAGLFAFLPGRIMHEVLFGPGTELGLMVRLAAIPVWTWLLGAVSVLLLVLYRLRMISGRTS
jgi:uncharacterized membrane protein